MKPRTILLAAILALLVGCAANVRYKTLAALETTTQAAVGAYLDLVVAGKAPTNGVPRVLLAFDGFQAGMRAAIAASQFNRKAPPDPELVDQSGVVLSAIADEKGSK